MQSVKRRNNIMLNGRWNEHAKLWVFHKMAKWRLWRLMLHDLRQWQLSWTRTVNFYRDRLNDTLLTSKTSSQGPDNPNCQSKLCKYRGVLQHLHVRDCDWCVTVDGGFWRWLIHHIANSSWREVLQNLHLAITQSLSQFIFLLHGCPHLDAMMLMFLFFPTNTRNDFRTHLRKIISRRPWPSMKNRDIHIKQFFFCKFYL